jgi:hypothetical protein
MYQYVQKMGDGQEGPKISKVIKVLIGPNYGIDGLYSRVYIGRLVPHILSSS